jgi:monofunctional glycosyltransferase
MGYIRRGYARTKQLRKTIKRWLVGSLLSFLVLSCLSVLILKWLPVYYTPLMFLRSLEYAREGKPVMVRKAWVPLEQISPHLQKAVIASEDPKFLNHWGFDLEAIGRAIDANRTRKHKLGASTISQQTAKNVFLYPSRTFLRKGLEAYFTLLIEALWDKKRILEVYLNVVELGPGIYGAEAAARHFYQKPAARLYLNEAHLFAAVLPNPRRWNPTRPSHFILKRRNFIQRNMGILSSTNYFKPLE